MDKLKKIKQIVTDHFTTENSNERVRENVNIRKMFYLLARETTNATFRQLGELYGQNHSTVRSAILSAKQFEIENILFKCDADLLRKKIHSVLANL